MTLVYCAVARGTAILSEYSVLAGNFAAVAKDYLAKASAGGRSSYTVDNHVFSFLADGGYSFVVVSDEAGGRAIPNAFLDRIQGDFSAKYGEKGKAAKEGGINAYNKRLKELMEHATQFPEEYSKVAGVQKRVDEVKAIMTENIDMVLSRGERLDGLVDKTDNLMHEADRFVKSGRALRRKMWWNNCKMKALVAGIVALLLVIIVCMLCFSGGGNRCMPKKGPAPSPSPKLAAAPGLADVAAAAPPPAGMPGDAGPSLAPTPAAEGRSGSGGSTGGSSSSSSGSSDGAAAAPVAGGDAASAAAAPAPPAAAAPAPAPAPGSISGVIGGGSGASALGRRLLGEGSHGARAAGGFA